VRAKRQLGSSGIDKTTQSCNQTQANCPLPKRTHQLDAALLVVFELLLHERHTGGVDAGDWGELEDHKLDSVETVGPGQPGDEVLVGGGKVGLGLGLLHKMCERFSGPIAGTQHT